MLNDDIFTHILEMLAVMGTGGELDRTMYVSSLVASNASCRGLRSPAQKHLFAALEFGFAPAQRARQDKVKDILASSPHIKLFVKSLSLSLAALAHAKVTVMADIVTMLGTLSSVQTLEIHCGFSSSVNWANLQANFKDTLTLLISSPSVSYLMIHGISRFPLPLLARPIQSTLEHLSLHRLVADGQAIWKGTNTYETSTDGKLRKLQLTHCPNVQRILEPLLACPSLISSLHELLLDTTAIRSDPTVFLRFPRNNIIYFCCRHYCQEAPLDFTQFLKLQHLTLGLHAGVVVCLRWLEESLGTVRLDNDFKDILIELNYDHPLNWVREVGMWSRIDTILTAAHLQCSVTLKIPVLWTKMNSYTQRLLDACIPILTASPRFKLVCDEEEIDLSSRVREDMDKSG